MLQQCWVPSHMRAYIHRHAAYMPDWDAHTHCNHAVLSDWTETPWSQLLSWSWALPLLRLLCSMVVLQRGWMAARPNVLGRTCSAECCFGRMLLPPIAAYKKAAAKVHSRWTAHTAWASKPSVAHPFTVCSLLVHYIQQLLPQLYSLLAAISIGVSLP